MPTRKSNGSIDWEKMIANGENPNGCVTQTSNETMRDYKALPPQEYKYGLKADGERWNNGFAQEPDVMPSVPANVKRRHR